MDVGSIFKGYLNEDEWKIGLGVWGGMYSSDLVAKFIYKTVFKNEDNKTKSLLVDIATKFLMGMLYNYIGRKNPFFRYMAVGSIVSIIDSVTNYFLPTPTSIMAKMESAVQKAGIVTQTF